jgi:hypothetical protein
MNANNKYLTNLLSSMSKNHINRAIRYEKRKAREHRGRHLGGPSAPDYQRGEKFGEVKCRDSKVTQPELQRLIREKGISEVDSKAGFTKPAIDYRNIHHPEVRLIKRRRTI